MASTTPTVRIELSTRSVAILLALVAALWLLSQLWQIAVILVVAVVLAGSLVPLADWLERHGPNRHVAMAIILVGLLGAVMTFAALVIPALVGQIGALITGAPELQRRLADTAAGIPLLAQHADALRDASPAQLLAPAASYLPAVAGTAAEMVAVGMTTAVLAFYLLADRERALGFLYALVPRRFHLRTARILLDMQVIVGGYMRGQAFTSLLIFAFVFGLLWLVGAPSPLALAALAAFADLVPFVGGILMTVPAVLAALTRGPGPAVIVLIGIVVYQEFESRFLVPRVYGRTLRLSPIAVTIALMVGARLLGIVGALLALPLAAGIRVLIQDLRVDLPGEEVAEPAEHAERDRAEAAFAAQTEGATAAESSVLAGSLAEQQHTRAN